ncbi:MAG: hypothetical protein MRY79_03365 [Alphaproteobacteria bacterium]|nr:hypothetical protein [Alphaproteobacteria bacterium]
MMGRIYNQIRQFLGCRFQYEDAFASLIFFVVFFIVFLLSSLANALETTKASALSIDSIAPHYSQSPSRPLFRSGQYKSQMAKSQDSCLSFLVSERPFELSGGSFKNSAGSSAKNSIGVGFVFGVRIALGSNVIVSRGSRVQVGPELRFNGGPTSRQALAIAAYRKCKSEQFLKTAQ